ncbi:hypothetical protein [Microbacterium luticocti]|uniref:hypothetical protein n=1 Tax=Microbacterium luticocti TaxID=451764 RepID=UPI001B7FE51B|nr:hypothetical protein [Microbacterium luticocti]
MTWTRVSPCATQAIAGSKVIWSTYRTIGGNVQVRGTDILAIASPGGYVNQWTKAKLTIELLDSSNVLRSKAVPSTRRGEQNTLGDVQLLCRAGEVQFRRHHDELTQQACVGFHGRETMSGAAQCGGHWMSSSPCLVSAKMI